MSIIAQRIRQLHEEIPSGVSLVAVSKFHPADAIREAYNAGQRLFGESRVKEFVEKVEALPGDIKWHFIGHLQTNKVRKIIGKTALIESVDTEHLLKCIDTESEKAGVVTMVLMQVHVAREETKFGFTADELYQFFREHRYEQLKATHICGIMGMASNTDDEQRVRSDFEKIAEIYRTIRDDESLGLHGFDTLSMGMSGDWPIAVETGSNLIRIGTYIFGNRQY
ncbi:MAG: YggS family pyridoxal phosphate-dependent enzyme [Muribaculaceae bacterium]|nr:YggS family pyridoxal phosphate-dependent enzyme [Muribaculaceae bacterium]